MTKRVRYITVYSYGMIGIVQGHSMREYWNISTASRNRLMAILNANMNECIVSKSRFTGRVDSRMWSI